MPSAIKRARMLVPYGKRPTTPEERRVLNQILMDRGVPLSFTHCGKEYPGDTGRYAWRDFRGRYYFA